MIRFFCLLALAISFGNPAFARTCSEDRNQSGSCFIQYDGPARGRCQVCRENKSCFIALDGRDRELCQAYVEGRSCFIATNNSTDRGWCEHLKEGKSCFMALDGAEREKCENGRIPHSHAYWIY